MSLFMPYANNKYTYQPAHPRSLISAFVVRCLDSITPTIAIQNFKTLISLCIWVGRFVSNLVANPKETFSRDDDDINMELHVTKGNFPNSVRRGRGKTLNFLMHKSLEASNTGLHLSLVTRKRFFGVCDILMDR